MGRLANEKTLELNITHELMTNVGSIGFTQDQESLTGADVMFPCGIPIILQYKATKAGADGIWGKFFLNNNQHKNQHQVLNELDKSGLCRAFYVFPLIASDSFLTCNFGRLLDFTCIVDASILTGRLNWQQKEHSVIIQNNYNFIVHSESFEGHGYSAKKLQEIIREQNLNRGYDIPVTKFVEHLLKKFDKIVTEANIFGRSEHTLIVPARIGRKQQLRYLQLPILMKGKERHNEEKVQFT